MNYDTAIKTAQDLADKKGVSFNVYLNIGTHDYTVSRDNKDYSNAHALVAILTCNPKR